MPCADESDLRLSVMVMGRRPVHLQGSAARPAPVGAALLPRSSPLMTLDPERLVRDALITAVWGGSENCRYCGCAAAAPDGPPAAHATTCLGAVARQAVAKLSDAAAERHARPLAPLMTRL